MSFLGIDVGGTKVALRAEGEGLEPCEISFRWPPGPAAADGPGWSADLTALAGWTAVLRERWQRPILSVGVAVPATVGAGGRVVGWPNRPSWTGLDLGEVLHELFPGARVGWADDGDLAALAEARAADAQDVVYVGVGTGIAGGVLVSGRPLPGRERGSCELGHLVVDRSGPVCTCGRRGCVQATASGPATLRRATDLRGVGVTFEELAGAFAAGTSWAVTAVRESCEAVAAAAVGVSELLALDLAVIGGGFARGIPGFTGEVDRAVAHLVRRGQHITVREAALGGLSSLHGAVLLAKGL
ncbi:ROK family protein [Streptomyces olivaceus]|uniref:ROK family protein n=1 Tax=Streptomyces olivaceus TaxID=47716 RepID=UPI001CC8F4DF|nr:ROK family protein [Streptomyces olivaceus]MBZ6286169.1 ROK family protein [Streptomyces olivaceus]